MSDTGERPSYTEGFTYRPVRTAPRKGAHEHTTGHAWRCLRCGKTAHEEPLVGIDHEETLAEAEARHKRINDALVAHRDTHQTSEEASTDD